MMPTVMAEAIVSAEALASVTASTSDDAPVVVVATEGVSAAQPGAMAVAKCAEPPQQLAPAVVQPVTQPVVEPGVQPVAQPIAQPIAQSAVPAAEPPVAEGTVAVAQVTV